MQNNIENKFEELLRQKLAHHSLPVDNALWEGVEAKMKAKKRVAFPFWLRYSAAAVAVVVAVSLLFVDVPGNDQMGTNKPVADITVSSADTLADDKQNTATHDLDKNHSADNKQMAEQKQANTDPNIKRSTAKTFANNNRTNRNAANALTAAMPALAHETKAENANESGTIDGGKLENVALETVPTSTETMLNKDVAVVEESKAAPKNKQALIETHQTWDDPLPRKRQKRSWFIAANVSTGSTSANLGNNMKTYASEARIVKAPAAAKNYVLTPSDFDNKSFAAPLSAGLSVARSVSDRLSVETGINYSQLNTQLSDRGLSADLNLHYVGLPLTLLAKIAQVSNFKFYASGGAMVEKGIYSAYTQEQTRGNQRINTTINNQVDGLQYSLNGAVGAAYAIDNQLEFYFEPRYSYYFDNNQPISIRTNNVSLIGFHAGIRFEIK